MPPFDEIALRALSSRCPQEETALRIDAHDVLIVTDVQNDFCPGGALAVRDGDAVIPVIHRLAPLFEHVILTQDWHSPRHLSFASAHPGKQPFETIQVSYGEQTLWPDHCVQQTFGAEFHPKLELPQAELILRKGFDPAIDSYSAFFENDRTTATGLRGYLRERGLQRVFLVGLAYDYCVGYSALDARGHGFETVVIRDGCRAIDLNGSVARIEAEFASAGVQVIESEVLLDTAAQKSADDSIRQGLQDVNEGRTRSVREFFQGFESGSRSKSD